MAILAGGLVLCAANPVVAAAKGGSAIIVLHVAGTGLFAGMLILEPWRIRNHKLRRAASVLCMSTSLEALFADYPWHAVQRLITGGCWVVAGSMACLMIFTLRPRRKMKLLFFIGLYAGAAGSLIISAGAFIATPALYRLDHSGALANLVVALGTAGLGLTCLGVRGLPILLKDGLPSARAVKEHLMSTGDLLLEVHA